MADKNPLEEFLGPELTVTLRTLLTSYIGQMQEAIAQRAEAQAAAAAALEGATLVGGDSLPGIQFAESNWAKNQLRERLFSALIANGNAPDRAWERANEAAEFFVNKCKELGIQHPSSLV